MFTQEVTQSRSEYFDHFMPSMASSKMNSDNLVSSTFLSPTFSEPVNTQPGPLNVYNNYNPNYHHHHYYFHPNYQDYGLAQQPNALENSSSWFRKYDHESQKEYFIANTPPSCDIDFEVPQRISSSPKPTAAKLFNDLDKIFFDDPIGCAKSNQSYQEPVYSLWGSESSCSEKIVKKSGKSREKVQSETDEKQASRFKGSKRSEGKFRLGSFQKYRYMLRC